MINLVQIQFTSETQMNLFVKWFNTKGFDSLVTYAENTKSTETITCLSTDEVIESGHYFELE